MAFNCDNILEGKSQLFWRIIIKILSFKCFLFLCFKTNVLQSVKAFITLAWDMLENVFTTFCCDDKLEQQSQLLNGQLLRQRIICEIYF
jgi:hypothetical protein